MGDNIKNFSFYMRMTEYERTMLQQLSRHKKTSASHIVRMLIESEYQALRRNGMSMYDYSKRDIEIVTDGKTVWINGEGGLIARFGVMGIDIHLPLDEQVIHGRQCLFCTKGKTTPEDWKTFKAKMVEFFMIRVSDDTMPNRFRKAS